MQLGRLEKFAIFIFAMAIVLNCWVAGGWSPSTRDPILQLSLLEAAIAYVPLRLLTWVFS